jgi:hypothetical protein
MGSVGINDLTTETEEVVRQVRLQPPVAAGYTHIHVRSRVAGAAKTKLSHLH